MVTLWTAIITALSLLSRCSATVIFHPSCLTSGASDGVDDAIAMATRGIQVLGANVKIRDATSDINGKGLFSIFYTEAERAALLYLWTRMSLIKSDPHKVYIYCTESDIVEWKGGDKLTDTNGLFALKSYLGSSPLNIAHEASDGLPRRAPCDADAIEAYTLNHPTAKESHIIICDRYLQHTFKGDDFRRPTEILSQGLQTGLIHLDDIRPFGKLLMHEFAHLTNVGGLNAAGDENIDDGPDDTMDFDSCWEFKRDNRALLSTIAEPQALLGLALTLQFQPKFPEFTWATGWVAVNQPGKKNYSPYVPDSDPSRLRRGLLGVHRNGMEGMERRRRGLVVSSASKNP